MFTFLDRALHISEELEHTYYDIAEITLTGVLASPSGQRSNNTMKLSSCSLVVVMLECTKSVV
jgi:hypothetical protein